MTYSSFVRDCIGSDKYARLEIELQLIDSQVRTYLVNVPRIKLPKGFTGVDMDESIDVIFQGDLSKLPLINAPAGIVEYSGQTAELAHAQARSARDTAEETKSKYHVYEPA